MTSGFVVHADAGTPAPGAGGRILAGATETGGDFSLLLSHASAGDEAPLHVHDHESESFFVLAGRYRIRCGDESFEAGEHDFVYLPRGISHAWQVVSPDAATKLILAVPGGIEGFFYDLVDGVSPDELAHRHGVRFLR